MSTSGILSSALIALSTVINIVWTLPLVILLFVGIRMYRVNDRDIYTYMLQKLGNYSTITRNGNKPQGYAFGKWFLAYISAEEIYIITIPSIYSQLSEVPNVRGPGRKMVTLFSRIGSYAALFYRERKIDVHDLQPTINQVNLLKMIDEQYKKTDKVVVYIHGDSGSGKSYMMQVLTKYYNSYMCNKYNPTDPGDNLSLLYNASIPSKTAPLIICIEEADKIITSIHEGSVKRHLNYHIEVHDKASWNTLFDEINNGLYPYVIVLLTANAEPADIHKLDPSYMRPGRVDIEFKMTPSNLSEYPEATILPEEMDNEIDCDDFSDFDDIFLRHNIQAYQRMGLHPRMPGKV